MMDEELILPTSWEPHRDEFFAALGLKATALGGQLFGHVFDRFFVYSIDLKREYEKYYAVEYSTLQEYIELCHGNSLSDEDLDKSRIFLISGLPETVNPVYDDNKLDVILACIKRLEKSHENQA